MDPSKPYFDERRVERETEAAVNILCLWAGIPAHRQRIRDEMRRNPYFTQRLREAAKLLAALAADDDAATRREGG